MVMVILVDLGRKEGFRVYGWEPSNCLAAGVITQGNVRRKNKTLKKRLKDENYSSWERGLR